MTRLVRSGLTCLVAVGALASCSDGGSASGEKSAGPSISASVGRVKQPTVRSAAPLPSLAFSCDTATLSISLNFNNAQGRPSAEQAADPYVLPGSTVETYHEPDDSAAVLAWDAEGLLVAFVSTTQEDAGFVVRQATTCLVATKPRTLPGI